MCKFNMKDYVDPEMRNEDHKALCGPPGAGCRAQIGASNNSPAWGSMGAIVRTVHNVTMRKKLDSRVECRPPVAIPPRPTNSIHPVWRRLWPTGRTRHYATLPRLSVNLGF
jgi:hypothetical protein